MLGARGSWLPVAPFGLATPVPAIKEESVNTVMRSLIRLSLLVGLLAALLACAGTAAAAEGPDLAVANIGGGSIFGGVQPTVSSSTDPHPVELGVRFESQTPLAIDGIRFFKGTKDTGTHIGHLWNSEGTLLATATFTEESATGGSLCGSRNLSRSNRTPFTSRRTTRPNGGYAEAKHFFESGPVVNGTADGVGGSERRLQVRHDQRIPDRNVSLQQLLRGRHVLDGHHRGPAGELHVRRGQYVGTSTSGTATLKAPLPAGLSWSQDDPSQCSIASGALVATSRPWNGVPNGRCTSRPPPAAQTATR